MNSITLNSYAKINLGLDVTGKLPNGYHTIKTVMQTVSLSDSLYLEKRENAGILLETNEPGLPLDEKNIVYKAISMFQREYGISQGIYCRITKNIPIAAGMAGGSGNGAAALIAMNSLFGTGLKLNELSKLGLSLGADVPYCLLGKTALSEGIGEILTPLPAPPKAKVLIVKPPISVSTAMVYQKLVLNEKTVHPDIEAVLNAIRSGSLEDMCSGLGNILEDVTVKIYPCIDNIKKEMLELGASGTLMSGSGPSVFGLFKNENTASSAYKHFKSLDSYKNNTYLCDFT